MKQSSLRDLHMKKQLRVVAFFKEMDEVIPWNDLLNALKPYYKTGEGGRPSHSRTHAGVQYEIREYADALEQLTQLVVPVSYKYLLEG